MVLMSIFIFPFIAFGLLFVSVGRISGRKLLNARVTEAEIRSQRRVFGMALANGASHVPTSPRSMP